MNIVNTIFGRKKNVSWEKIAEEIDASYQKGSFNKSFSIVRKYKSWEIVLDTHRSMPIPFSNKLLRVWVNINNQGSLAFNINAKQVLSDLWYALEEPHFDIDIDSSNFESNFYVNEDDFINNVLDNQFKNRLIRLQCAQMSIHKIKKPIDNLNSSLVLFSCLSEVDTEATIEIFNLFEWLLDEMVERGEIK